MRVPRPRTRKQGLLLLVVLSLAVACSVGIARVWTNLRAIEYGYKISKERTTRAKLLEANRRLKIEAALLKAPARISAIAARRGLRPPEPEQIRRLSVTARRAPPRPASRPPQLARSR